MYKSGFAHTGNINQNTTLWSTGSTNGKACFYLDDDYCKSNALVQFRREFSYAISSDAADDAYITKTLHVSQNTNYVVNVMVKSTFLKAFTDDFSILPSYIKVLVGSTTLATSIDCVGITNEWTEMSVGFNSGTNTTVTLKVGAVFNSISKREAVYFSSIRVDTITPTKVLLLAYPRVYYQYTEENLIFEGNYTANGNYGVTEAANAMASQFKEVLKLVSNGKLVADVDVCVPTDALGRLTVSSTNYTVTLKDVAENGQLVTGYDCVICNIPMIGDMHNRTTTFGVYQGLFTGNGSSRPDGYDLLDGTTGFIYLTKPFLQDFINDRGIRMNMDGEIHEFVHYVQDCASHLDKRIRKNYPYIDDLERNNGTKDMYGKPVTFTRNGTSYTYYEAYYNHLLASSNSTYAALFEPFKIYDRPDKSFKYKYRWYYDVLNGCVQDCYREAGVWGMLSNWVEIGCNSMTYHMPQSMGLKPGVYTLMNYYSKDYLDSDMNSSNQLTQSDKSYNTDQYWEFKPAANGTFEIIPLANSSKRLTATSTTAVTLSAANNSDNQRWKVTCITGNRYSIASVSKGTYLSLASQSANYMVLTATAATGGIGGWSFSDVNAVGEGLYKITSLYSQKLASYMPSTSSSVIQNEYLYDPGQVWQVKLCLDGYLQIIPLSNTAACLTVPNSGDVAIQTNTEANNQKWLIVSIGTDTYRIIPKAYSIKALDITGPSIQNGAVLHLWDYINTATQMKWNVTKFHEKDSFACRLKSAFSQKYLKDNDNTSIAHDVVQHTRLEDSSYTGWGSFDSNHKYSANFVWEFQLQKDGFYKIIPLSSPLKRLTAASTTSNPAILSLKTDRTTDDQKWVLFDLGDGKFRISPKNNITKAVVLYGPVSTDDNFMQLWTFNTTSEVRWYVETFEQSFTGRRFTLSTKEVPSKFLDARDDNSTAARPESVSRDDIVTIYSANQGSSQIWRFTWVDGFYEITPTSNYNYRMSGIIRSTGNPNAVRKKYADSSEEQKWLVESVGEGYYRIAPRDNPSKSLVLNRVNGVGFSVEGNLVQLWIYNSTNEVKIIAEQVKS